MNTDIEFVQKFNLAYNAMCKPLCQQLKLPQTAFDILMFFGNNPEYHTASDVVEIRRIKANLVSVNVDKLVREGYLERREAPDCGISSQKNSSRHWNLISITWTEKWCWRSRQQTMI